MLQSTVTRDNEATGPARTVIALFDDTIDAEHALTVLSRMNQVSDEISVILRERVIDDSASGRHQTVLSRVVASSALDAVGGWLQGLASLILPDRASYLVAGPIGAVLATIRDASPRRDDDAPRAFDEGYRQLARALSSFGFSRDEATYLEQRVVAGSPLIAVTSSDADTLRSAHRTFAAHTAVHLGLARTEQAINRTAARLLMTGPDGGGSAVIADAIAPLRRISDDEGVGTHQFDWRGRGVETILGEPVGTVADVLFERRFDDQTNAVQRDTFGIVSRYLIVSTRGLLGLGRQRFAVPSPIAELRNGVVQLSTTRDTLQTAPRFDDLTPMSRQDEVKICLHFDVPLYWMEEPVPTTIGPGI